MKPKQKILVIRNDKLGDFMLAWPVLALLRKNLPKARIAVLVPSYTAPLTEACSYIDEVIVDPELKSDVRNGLALAKLLKPKKFDAVITLFSRFDTGLGVWLAGIPQRYAPATKLAQLFYNHRILQRRSHSEKPEYEYNLDIARKFLAEQGIAKPKAVEPPYLTFKTKVIAGLERKFRKAHKIQAKKKLVFVHAGHGGSATNLSLGHYASLIHKLASSKRLHFVLTAGPGEEEQSQRIASLLSKEPHSIYVSKKGLLDFARHLQFCDVFISGSTGPLHIAGALDCCTAAFYPRRRSSTALRWQTVNTPSRRLAFEPPDGSEENDVQAIDLTLAAAKITDNFF
ncbi:MAG: glycosyltransferase family 9 protein [Gammaproteobacteria bacterium]